jgi:hypothetical protein
MERKYQPSEQRVLVSELNAAFLAKGIKVCWAFFIDDHNIDKDGPVPRVMVEVESQMGDPMFQMYFNVNAKPEAVLKVVEGALGGLS